jgi:phage N-6-adenine-methyltransferase
MNRGEQSVMFSSDSTEWETPQWLIEKVKRIYGGIELDAASTDQNAVAKNHMIPSNSALEQTWKAETVWCNPPYGKNIWKWMDKAFTEALEVRCAKTVICLVPARTDTSWFHNYCAAGHVRLLRGRLKFTIGKVEQSSAPFPSALVTFGTGHKSTVELVDWREDE